MVSAVLGATVVLAVLVAIVGPAVQRAKRRRHELARLRALH